MADNALDDLVVAHARCHNDKRGALAGLDPSDAGVSGSTRVIAHREMRHQGRGLVGTEHLVELLVQRMSRAFIDGHRPRPPRLAAGAEPAKLPPTH